MKQHVGRQILVVFTLALSSVLASQSIAYASGVSVSGGGVVSGDLGTTSQLGFTASSSGGEFLCVMAGRSGGFSFGPWASIAQMRVHGTVIGPVTISGGVASFSGTATIHVVGRSLESGDILTATVPNVPFTSLQTAGGAGVATHRLEVTLDGSVVAFPDLSAQADGTETVLTGPLVDQAALYGVLAQLEALGLELLELHRTGG